MTSLLGPSKDKEWISMIALISFDLNEILTGKDYKCRVIASYKSSDGRARRRRPYIMPDDMCFLEAMGLTSADKVRIANHLIVSDRPFWINGSRDCFAFVGSIAAVTGFALVAIPDADLTREIGWAEKLSISDSPVFLIKPTISRNFSFLTSFLRSINGAYCGYESMSFISNTEVSYRA